MGMLYLQEIAMLSHGSHSCITEWSSSGHATKSLMQSSLAAVPTAGTSEHPKAWICVYGDDELQWWHSYNSV